jgi:hypothetical protein
VAQAPALDRCVAKFHSYTARSSSRNSFCIMRYVAFFNKGKNAARARPLPPLGTPASLAWLPSKPSPNRSDHG